MFTKYGIYKFTKILSVFTTLESRINKLCFICVEYQENVALLCYKINKKSGI